MKANWSSLDKGSMHMKIYKSHKQAKNDLTHPSLCLAFKEGAATHRLLYGIGHLLVKHTNKPPNLPSNKRNVNLHDTIIPTALLKII